ncbi:MAG: DUF3341 domain-containing protein [Ignavibacteriales bacterium]|nr:MAG: DUF3341 domain-containing protein [Ignavibacteriales bacterium]
MTDKILYSVTGLFNNPDDIINAAEQSAKAGYKKYDINTPYPVHGLSKAMRIPSSKLGYVALFIGLGGVLFAVLAMSWIAIFEYPIVVGGKPFFSLPAFIPITFEVTVLSASIATVVAMLFFFFKLPNISHPLHDTDYMKSVSVDKFGISIQADDPLFNEEQVKHFLNTLKAEKVTSVYYDDEEVNTKHKVFEPKFIMFLIVVAVLNSVAVYFIYNKLLYMEPFNWMVHQFKMKGQQESTFFVDGFGMRQPVEGTVSRGNLPYLYTNNQAEASVNMINSLLPSKANLEKGQKKYNTFCSPCHGYFGKGDSRLRGQFPAPPSLQSEKVRNWKDGDIFHVITAGQNVMPSYASQLTAEERWQVILYIRALQRSQNARETDLQ